MPTVLDRLRKFLQPEIEQGLVEVTGTVGQPLVRITARGMFASGSATVDPKFKPLLERIGLALKEEHGAVHVIGYTDDQPIRTIAFPSNFQLSAARALAAGKIMAVRIGDPGRLSAEGRADADPIAPNSTPEGRERNRRIEVLLDRKGD
jgi:type VI secretion system protein ImpK